jgi:copper chaperone
MITLSIPDMSCGHCKASVEQALGALPGVDAVSVDLTARNAVVTGTTTPDTLLQALDAVGFPAKVMPAL